MRRLDGVLFWAGVFGLVAALLYSRGYRVLLKDGVVLALAPEMAQALPTIDDVHLRVVERTAIITSGSEGYAGDGVHSDRSLHYVGKAIDVRTRDLTAAQITALAAALRVALGPDFDVVVESDHIHIEFDPN